MSARYAKQKIKWLFWRLDTTRPVAMGEFRGSAPQISFVLPQIFLFTEKFVLKI